MVKIFEKNIVNNRLTVKFFGIKLFTHKLKPKFNKNVVVLIKENGKRIYNPKIKGLSVKFGGNYNVVKLYEPLLCINKLSIGLKNKDKVEIRNSKNDIQKLHIECMGRSKVFIDEDFSVADGIFIADYGSKIEIGKDAMFSFQTVMQTGDEHIIYNKANSEFMGTNDIKIGNHVWVGFRAKILKKSVIPDGCIVGMDSTVTKPFDTPNSVIAGIPAKIIKTDIRWDRTHYFEMKTNKLEKNFAEKFSQD